MIDVAGPYELGIGVAAESRLGKRVVLRGNVGRRGSVFGLQRGVSFGATALALVGVRWVELEGGLGVNAEAGTSADGFWTPTAYGGLRFSLPYGRDREGETVPRDIVLRAGGAALFFNDRRASYGEPIAFPSLSAGLAF